MSEIIIDRQKAKLIYLLRYLQDQTGEDYFALTAEEDVSSTFYARLFRFGGKVKLLSPSAAEEYAGLCRQVAALHR